MAPTTTNTQHSERLSRGSLRAMTSWLAPLIDETMLREVKFGDMVRAAMLQAEVAGR